MRLALVILCLAAPALAGSNPVVSAPKADAVIHAEAALMDGDYARAARLAEGLAGPEAARILGEAREATGDLKGAAKAFAEAAQDPDASAWLQHHAKVLGDLATAPTPTLKPTARPTLLASFTFTATATPTRSPTAAPSSAATSGVTAIPTSIPSMALTPDPSIQAEREKLARERKELDEEKAHLADERRQMHSESTPPIKRTQGLTFYVGLGVYQAKVVDKLNDAIQRDSQGSGQGPAPFIEVPFSKTLGLRWEGFSVEGLMMEEGISYVRPPGNGSAQGYAKLKLSLLSLGYDWAFVRRGTWLGPVELALPLRVEFGEMKVQLNNQSDTSTPGGLTVGLSLRLWATQRLLIELQGLYHMQPGDKNNDSNGSCGGPNGCGGPSSGNNASASVSSSHDGPEGRLNIGWRFL